MQDARRRIQQRVGDEEIRLHLHYPTTKSLVGQRLGSFAALQIVHMSARDCDETVSVAIGIRPDGRLVTLESTPERRRRRRQKWIVWDADRAGDAE